MTRSHLLAALVGAAFGLASSAAAQGLPAYAPINPVVTSRSALYFQPYEASAPAWRVTTQFDWSSIVEYHLTASPTLQRWDMDAEILRLDVTMVRDYGTGNFVLLGAGVASVQDGLLDGFFDWFHDFTGFPHGPRKLRPKNEFAYEGIFPDESVRSWGKPALMLTDVKVGVGVRNTPTVQTLIYATLPTATHPDGYGRGTVSANGIITARSALSDRVNYEGSFGVGWTPRHGDLGEYQKTVFYAVSSGLRFRFWGRQAMFFNAFWQSANYRETGLPPLDRAELTGDMGFLLRPGRRAPELVLALTEDLLPSGPAIDAAFRIGLRW